MSVLFLKYALKPFLFVFQLLNRIFWSGLNGRTVFQLVLNFWLNFSPVFIWLLMFKNAGIIPKEIRPKIYVALAMHVDDYMFNFVGHPLISTVALVSLVSGAWLIYYVFYRTPTSKKQEQSYSALSNVYKNELHNGHSIDSDDPTAVGSSSETSSDLEDFNEYELTDMNSSSSDLGDVSIFNSPGDWQDDTHHSSIEFFKNLSSNAISTQTSETNRRIWRTIKTRGYGPLNCWNLSPPILMALSWFLLNIDYWFKDPINTPKDLLAWTSYVLFHFFVPLFTAIWLYVFHAPGALRLFSFGLGMQNIAGVCTHLLFPNAPPWFIHLYDEDAEATYDLPGYAAGLTRVDMAMGTHLNSNGFHASPIVFGALPSLHSAMAVMAFFFVSYYSRWTTLKLLAASFVALQWWATIYLDHHWRLDLVVGMLYAITSFTLLYCWPRGIKKVDSDFMKARLRFDFKNGSTMGMRVFRNTRLQNFFDPLA